MNRNQLKAVLKINGYTEESSDADIRAVLLSASYSKTEVERALLTLRQSEGLQAARADGLHTVFYSDNHLRPSEISGLLGIDIDVNFQNQTENRHTTNSFSLFEGLFIIGLAIVCAAFGIFMYMYINSIGVFHSIVV